MILYYCNLYPDPKVEAQVGKYLGKVPMLSSYFRLPRNLRPCDCVSGHFLDSGAYSSLTSGKPIDLDTYIAFIHRHLEFFTEYAGLDVIGNPKATIHNQLEMEKQGLEPVPTFHFGEDLKWLKKYAKKYDRIALGGMVPIKRKPSLVAFLNECFNVIGAENRTCKVHGFGVQDFEIIEKFPFHSVDSTAAHRLGFSGLIPTRKGHRIRVMKGRTKAAAWVHSRPNELREMREWVEELCPGMDFELVQHPSVPGKIRRIAVCVAYYEREIAKLTKRQGPIYIRTDYGKNAAGFF